MAPSPKKYSLIPRPRKTMRRTFTIPDLRAPLSGIVVLLLVGVTLLSLPSMLQNELRVGSRQAAKPPFPVSVDPVNEIIHENAAVDALFNGQSGTLGAAASLAGGVITSLANMVSSIPGYSQLAGSDLVFVDIKSGFREEEVARAFGVALGWTRAEQTAFLKRLESNEPTLSEGQFVPGIYMMSSVANAAYVQQLLHDRYQRDVVDRYTPEAAQVLPIEETLTIASMIQRETRDPAEMRLISGIIWNRLWIGMNLQIDATLQYAKASAGGTKTWWPVPIPDDKYIKSPYNTYQNKGLPPAPISNPSTEAILAALNPVKTDCLFYFHNARGKMFCSPDYEGHVQMLRKEYGRGR